MFQIDLIDIFEYANAQITADGSSQKIIIYKEKSYDVIKLYQYSLKIGTLIQFEELEEAWDSSGPHKLASI